MSVLDPGKWVIVILVFLSPMVMTGNETRIKYAPAEENFVLVKGTSSLHDWSVKSDQIQGRVELKGMLGSLSLNEIFSSSSDAEKPVVQVSIPAASLISNKKAMDHNMYKALKTSEYPAITYDLKEITAVEIKDAARLIIQTRGFLNVAGVSRTLEMSVTVDESKNNTIVFAGNTSFKMSDFEIKPPKAMLGMLKTGNEVLIEFKWAISPSIKEE